MSISESVVSSALSSQTLPPLPLAHVRSMPPQRHPSLPSRPRKNRMRTAVASGVVNFCLLAQHHRLPANAADQSPHCQHWAKTGECKNRRKYMWSACQDACSEHAPDTRDEEGEDEHSSAPTSLAGDDEGDVGDPEKQDKNPHCAAWGKAGECTKRKKYMWANCRATCGKILGDTTGTEQTGTTTTPAPEVVEKTSTTPPPTPVEEETTTTTSTTATTSAETTTSTPTTSSTTSSTTTASTTEAVPSSTTESPPSSSTSSSTTSTVETTSAPEEKESAATATPPPDGTEQPVGRTPMQENEEQEEATTTTTTTSTTTTTDPSEEIILSPVADYAKMEKLSEEDYNSDLKTHERMYEEILAKLNKVETRDTDDLLAAVNASLKSDESADGRKTSGSKVKTGRELLDQQLKTVPTVNQMRTKFANINARAAQFEDKTDSPFGGELDEMIAYGFSSLDDTVQKGVQNHLLCYAKGVDGEGRCRIIKTHAGRSRNELVKGDSTLFGVDKIRSLMLKPIAMPGFFLLCHDSSAQPGCMILEVKSAPAPASAEGNDPPSSDVEPWPLISYHTQPPQSRFQLAAATVSKLLSLIVTRPPVHTDLRVAPAEFAVCYKTMKNKFQCDQGTFDDRDPLSLTRRGEEEVVVAGGVTDGPGTSSSSSSDNVANADATLTQDENTIAAGDEIRSAKNANPAADDSATPPPPPPKKKEEL
ncbi:unnamed protein product [Amoebophrya sp. A120]|nr:unnamed protein product [Amoebophrya sp. A120]|eukprot:GSA120T00021257001.1